MEYRETLFFNYQINSEKALCFLQSKGLKFINSSFIWQILIYELDHYDIPTEVIFYSLSSNEIILIIEKYFVENGLPIKNITIDNSIIPDELNNDLIKAQIKFKGEIWTIHKNDKDTFPSQPHAHNYDRQFKLHLGNGKLFRKKEFIRSINKDDLLNLRQIITERINIKLPLYEN